MRKLTTVILIAIGLVLVGAVSAGAQVVPPHQHFLVTPGGMMIPIGPDSCTKGPSRAFDHFHFNVHLGTPNLEAWQNPNNAVSFIAPVPCP
jgi:hypothetical protein